MTTDFNNVTQMFEKVTFVSSQKKFPDVTKKNSWRHKKKFRDIQIEWFLSSNFFWIMLFA